MPLSTPDSATRNRSNSGEDVDLPEHERKRPRLSESNSDSTRFLNANPAATASKINSFPSTSTDMPETSSPRPPLPPRSINNNSMNNSSPTSKVTINTRPLSSQSMTQSIPQNTDGSVDIPDNAVLSPTPAQPTTSSSNAQQPVASDQHETVSISSSSSGSPEIEIAEVEDYDQHPTETRWTTRIGGSGNSTSRPAIAPFHVYQTFPLAADRSPGEGRFAVNRIARIFVDGKPDDGELFHRAKNWLSHFAAACDSLTDSIIDEDREFWNRLPNLVESLLKRDLKAPSHVQIQDLVDFFVAYGKVAKLTLHHDVRKLQSMVEVKLPHGSREWSFLSWNYTMPLVWILSVNTPFYNALQRYHNFNVMLLINAVSDELIDPSRVDMLAAISSLVSTITLALPKNPELYKTFPILFNALSVLVSLITPSGEGALPSDFDGFSQLENLRAGIEDILLKMDALLQEGVTKQYSWLTIDTGGDFVSKLNNIMRIIAVEVPRVGRDIITAAGVNFQDQDLTDLPYIMPYAWKFMILRKFIKHGRMELRVYGIETMSADLVSIYFSHISQKANGQQDPLVKFLVRFIQENQMVSYIIGVDSHPQLIQRSSNIVGFLCVAGTYTESDTDDIWNVVTDSQDPRTMLEVLSVLQQCFNTFDLTDLHYLCKKLIDLPLAKYNERMVDFTVSLLMTIRTKPHGVLDPAERFHPVTRELCIRLLRDGNTSENRGLDQAAQIRREIPSQFQQFLLPHREVRDRLAISQEEETQLFANIRVDLDLHTDGACGAIQIISCILTIPTLSMLGIEQIVERCDLPLILIQDLVYLHETTESKDIATDQPITMEYECRLACLSNLLRLVPSRFDDKMLEALWSYLLTAEEVPLSTRNLAWDQITSVMKHSKTRNETIDKILHDFLPRLKPTELTGAVLKFAMQSVLYEGELVKTGVLSCNEVITIPGIERVWQIMLEAPPGTVETDATDFVIDQYLRGSTIVKYPSTNISETHLALIDRCVNLVLGCAARLKSFSTNNADNEDEEDGMVIIASEAEIQHEISRFDRLLLFLRRFSEAVSGKTGSSPGSPKFKEGLPEFGNKSGELRDLIIQIPSNKYVSNAMRRVTIGVDNSGSELWQYLANVSGFTRFEVFHGGKRLNLRNEDASLADLKITSGLVIVHKAFGTQEQMPASSLRNSSPVEEKMMLHFNDFYALLESDNRMAREVFNFLSVSSLREAASTTIRSMTDPAEQLLVAEKPYKLLFCAQALRSIVEAESYSEKSDIHFLSYAVHAITFVLPRLNFIATTDLLNMSIAHELIDILILAFRAKVPLEVSQAYITDHEPFVRQLLVIMETGCRSEGLPTKNLPPEVIIKAPFEALVESCLHDERVWQFLDGDPQQERVVLHALLLDDRDRVRQAILDVVFGLTGSSGTKISGKIANTRTPKSRFSSSAIEYCLNHLWQLLMKILPVALEKETHCQEFFSASLVVFKRICKSLETASLLSLFEEWKSALVCHEYQQVVGQGLRDHVIAGITQMLLECSKILRDMHVLPSSYDLVKRIVSKFLFPPLSDDATDSNTANIPILDVNVREGLYDLVLTLCQSEEELDALVFEVNNDLIPQDFFEPNIVHERQSLRTEVGYAGLRNLSNTCYLNSLLSQLFMNVQFRELLLNASILDEKRQKLVIELSKVFAHMQNSHEKSVDPSAAVESIVTYDGDQIDVTVQMDVDEFFNLLFDRLEGQIVEPAAKDAFKSLYGGQTMHQIKSKECEHISERPEPFSALQIEIKGKSRLEDSLRAYVEGEVLQGENKYSCTACGRHVDAVKRACLKEVPDNLIFNLKRFDYDIMTGMRCKLNDQFQFPETIDISPYTLEQLSNPGKQVASDEFELTGIIVHSGTADSGHYYSFIRQRPSSKDKHQSWAQFNDHDVMPFDPATIQDACFGGIDPSCYNIAKFYNAYMLFYQRKSSIQQIEKDCTQHDAMNPVRLRLSDDMENHIAQQNELFLRSYCAQDPSHARFVRQILEQLRSSHPHKCSNDHRYETNALLLALDYVQQVSSRWKSHPEMESTMKLVNIYGKRCTTCAKVIFQWCLTSKVLPDSIVRSPSAATRKTFCSVLKTCLQSLHDASEGLEADITEGYFSSLEDCLHALLKSWEFISRLGRPWPEYFGLLGDILQLGIDEAKLVFETGFLERCLDIIMLHNNDNLEFRNEKKLRLRFQGYLNARDKNRPFNHGVLITLFATMLTMADLNAVPREGSRAAALDEEKIGLTLSEREALGILKLPYNLEWLRRIIAGRQAPVVADSLVMYLAADRTFAGAVSGCLVKGLDHKSMPIAASFLQPTITYCAYCWSDIPILDVVQPALEGIQTIGLDYGREYVAFIQSLLQVENETIEAEPGFLKEVLLQNIQHWAPVCLVAANETQHDVRGDAVDIVRRLLFEPLDHAQQEDIAVYRALQASAQELAYGAAKYATAAFLSTKEEMVLQRGQLHTIINVVRKCCSYIDMDNPVQEERIAEIESIMNLLRLKAEQSVETMSAAEWQESSEVEAMSEAEFEETTSP